MNGQPPKRLIVTVKLTARQRSDPKSQLEAVRDAMRANQITLRVLEISDPEESQQPSPHQAAQERLEAVALHAAAELLEKKAKEFQTQAGKTAPPAAPPANQKANQAATRETLVKIVARLCKEGWRFAVDVVKRMLAG